MPPVVARHDMRFGRRPHLPEIKHVPSAEKKTLARYLRCGTQCATIRTGAVVRRPQADGPPEAFRILYFPVRWPVGSSPTPESSGHSPWDFQGAHAALHRAISFLATAGAPHRLGLYSVTSEISVSLQPGVMFRHATVGWYWSRGGGIFAALRPARVILRRRSLQNGRKALCFLC